MVVVKSEGSGNKKEGEGSGARLPGFKSWLCYFLPEFGGPKFPYL